MPRPRKPRRCRSYLGDRVFKPRAIPLKELSAVRLELSELEAMRLCDLLDLDQEGAGRRMGVSRGTVQRLLASGRTKVVRALVENHALLIEEKADHEETYARGD
jgi:predicted DNA-binding protein (UPF0251 family)